jgi:hypothetical protein
MSGAASLLEMVDSQTSKRDTESILQQTREQLYLSMTWCASRQFIVDVTSGQYQSVIAPVNMRSFIRDITFQDGQTRFVINDETASLQVDDQVIAFDKNMAMLACENAVTNSKAHGDGDVVHFTASFESESGKN